MRFTMILIARTERLGACASIAPPPWSYSDAGNVAWHALRYPHRVPNLCYCHEPVQDIGAPFREPVQ